MHKVSYGLEDSRIPRACNRGTYFIKFPSCTPVFALILLNCHIPLHACFRHADHLPVDQISLTPSYRRESYRRRLDIAIDVQARGVPGVSTSSATLLEISSSGCRIRSQHTFELGARVAFDLPSASAPLKLDARIVSRGKSVANFIYDYALSFSGLSKLQKDQLTQALVAFGRLDAVAVAFKKRGDVKPSLTQTRIAYREEVTFPVRCASGEQVFSDGHVSDVSIDGMRLWVQTALEQGSPLELTFTPPSYVLWPDSASVDVGRQMGTRSSEFREISAQAVVVARQPSNTAKLPHGIQFVDLPCEDRQELARFIRCLQLYKSAQRAAPLTERSAP